MYLCSYLYAQNIAIQRATEVIESLKEVVNKKRDNEQNQVGICK